MQERLDVLHQRYDAARKFTRMFDPPKPIGKTKHNKDLVEQGLISKEDYKIFMGEDYETKRKN